MIRILIADDHPIVRRGLKDILESEADMTVAGEAENGTRALELARAQHWDAVVLDLTMPGKTGLEVLKQLADEQPKLPVLILSVHPEDQYALRALRAGASGYMTKETAPEQLVAAVRRVIAGGKYISASLAERLAGNLRVDPTRPPHESLSDREFQVLRLLAQGRTVGQIAEELFLSPKTVSTYRARVLEKMSLDSNGALMRYAMEHGLVD